MRVVRDDSSFFTTVGLLSTRNRTNVGTMVPRFAPRHLQNILQAPMPRYSRSMYHSISSASGLPVQVHIITQAESEKQRHDVCPSSVPSSFMPLGLISTVLMQPAYDSALPSEGHYARFSLCHTYC